MSDARIAFTTLDSLPAKPGAEQCFAFACPRFKRRCGGDMVIIGRTHLAHDPQNQNGGVAQWGWDGNRDAPTFSPSIDCKGCWHGYIRAGRCVDTNGVDMPEPQER